MKARLPKEYQNRGANNMNSMIKQAQKSGAKVLKEVKLNPEVVDKDAIEDLQDVIVAGVNAVITQIEEVSAAEMEKVTGGVNIPGLV